MKYTPSTATARGVRVLLATIVGVMGLSFNAAADEKSVAIHVVKATGPG